jgi:hypothetical protein
MPIRSLALLLGDVRAAAAYRYGAEDSLGNRMDTAKVIQSPAGDYLAVYHSGRVCQAASRLQACHAISVGRAHPGERLLHDASPRTPETACHLARILRSQSSIDVTRCRPHQA